MLSLLYFPAKAKTEFMQVRMRVRWHYWESERSKSLWVTYPSLWSLLQICFAGQGLLMSGPSGVWAETIF